MGALTIIIPTFNRKDILAKVVEGYFVQTALEVIHEMIVVDDGSTDGTEYLVAELTKRSPFPIRYLRQSNKGPAAARNVGIREANTEILLFTDSDVVPDRHLIEQHMKWHRAKPEGNVAVLGYVTWPPVPPPTPFMKWYGEHKLFCYNALRHANEISFVYFYTCNLSLKSSFLKLHGQFDEDFKTAAFEDTELGYRLNRAGLRLIYNRDAIAFHHQFFSFADACRKARNNFAADQLFRQKEAGVHLQMIDKKRKSQLSYRLGKWLATAIASALRPARRVIDSGIWLPSICYHLLFWYYTANWEDPRRSAIQHEVL